MTADVIMSEGIIKLRCPASIWLLGSAANCSKGAGHDGNHEVKIEWIVR